MIQVLVESAGGAVEIFSFTTRIDAVLFMERATAEADRDARRITLCESGLPIYTRKRTDAGWKDEPGVG